MKVNNNIFKGPLSLIAQQPRPVPKLMLKTKDSFTTNGRPNYPLQLGIQNPVSRFDQNNYNKKIMSNSWTNIFKISLLICCDCFVGL